MVESSSGGGARLRLAYQRLIAFTAFGLMFPQLLVEAGR